MGSNDQWGRGPGEWCPPGNPRDAFGPEMPDFRRLALTAGRLSVIGARAEFERAVTTFIVVAESAGWPAVETGTREAFVEVLASAWESGWQPMEVVREVSRKRTAAHGRLVVAAVSDGGVWDLAAGAPMPDDWSRQLTELGVICDRSGLGGWILRWVAGAALQPRPAIRAILEVLGVLMTLPPIERLLVPPTEWARVGPRTRLRRSDDPVLAKIRALLAKAESTDFEAESEALTAKAQQLMSRHAIDEALTRADHGSDERPATRRLAVDDPYATAKSQLLYVVARANGAPCVWYGRFAMMAVVGFESDLDAVEILFTSLLMQASRDMLAQGSVSDLYGRSRTRSFRQSFLLAFAGRIRERLVTAANGARQQAERELATSLLPVLARRDDEVTEAFGAMFPSLRKVAGPRVTNGAGWRAGRTAAECATLGPERRAITGLANTA